MSIGMRSFHSAPIPADAPAKRLRSLYDWPMSMVNPDLAGKAIEIGGAAFAVGPAIKATVERMFGPSLDAVGNYFGDRVADFLGRNAAMTAARAAECLNEAGASDIVSEIPLRVAIPLLRGAASEDDSALREMWALLMAKAALAEDKDDVPPAFAHILSQLSPFDAQVLRDLRRRPISNKTLEIRYPGKDPSRVNASVDLLISLGLARRVGTPPYPGGLKMPQLGGIASSSVVMVDLGALGKRFVDACAGTIERQKPING